MITCTELVKKKQKTKNPKNQNQNGDGGQDKLIFNMQCLRISSAHKTEPGYFNLALGREYIRLYFTWLCMMWKCVCVDVESRFLSGLFSLYI